jgi:hypothetical protein
LDIGQVVFGNQYGSYAVFDATDDAVTQFGQHVFANALGWKKVDKTFAKRRLLKRYANSFVCTGL